MKKHVTIPSVFSIALSAFGIFAALIVSSCASYEVREGGKVYEVVLDGDHNFWTEYAEIWIEAGDKVTFDAEGKILWDPALQESEVGPEGASWTPAMVGRPEEFLLTEFPIAALIGMVADRTFGIGKHAEITITQSGTLHLAINERWRAGCWDDNGGSFKVKIAVRK